MEFQRQTSRRLYEEHAATLELLGRVERVLTPTGGDWARAGRLIARYSQLHGGLKPRDHLADVLILVSAAHLSGVVLTANSRHFEVWANLAQKSGLTVGVERYSS